MRNAPTQSPTPPPSGLRPRLRSAGELIQAHPQLRPPVIHGLLREGERLNIIATPKTGKSWIVLDLTLAVASGRSWLGLEVERGQVLIIDNELHPETMADRIPKVAGARGIPPSEYDGMLFVDNLRGRLKSLAHMASYFDAIEPGRLELIVLDAWYRLMETDTDENDDGAMTEMYNLLDKFAGRLGCSFVCVHHSTKGTQAGKSITDVGAGAGAQSRAADAHMILRRHAEPGCIVVEAVARSWPPPNPICLRWDFPVWQNAYGLDPSQLHGTKPPKDSGARGTEQPTVADVVGIVRGKQPVGRETLNGDVEKATKFSTSKATKLVTMAVEQKLIVNSVKAANKSAIYTLPDYVAPEPVAGRSTEVCTEPGEPSACVP